VRILLNKIVLHFAVTSFLYFAFIDGGAMVDCFLLSHETAPMIVHWKAAKRILGMPKEPYIMGPSSKKRMSDGCRWTSYTVSDQVGSANNRKPSDNPYLLKS
jgi:hypothetical protein